MSINWKGVFPAVTTKFKADESIDFPAMAKNIEAQIEAGVDGIILCGTLGEAGTLSRPEKLEILKETLKVVAGRVPVVLNIAESRTSDALAYVKEAEQAGANGFMCLPPLRYYADERETLAWFSAIASATSLPIMVYNNPVDYKIEITIEMFRQLAAYKNIEAVKESTRDVSNTTRMINEFGDRFTILCGVDTLAMECLVMGAHGWVAGLVCAFPKETVAIFKLIKAGRIEEAREIYRWFLPLLELDIHPKLVQYIKLAETQTGLGTEYTRAPRLPLEAKERERVLGIIKAGLAKRPILPELHAVLS